MSSVMRFRYDPFVEFDRLFDDALNARFWPSAAAAEASHRTNARRHREDGFRPKLDLYEAKDSDRVTAIMELPGLTSEDVTIDVYHNCLTISGECVTATPQEEVGYAVRERHYGKFSRTL